MKSILPVIATIIVLLSTGIFAQGIPPYQDSSSNGDEQTYTDSNSIIPSSASANNTNNVPGRAGCYVIEDGAHFYYQSGKYYKEQNDTDSTGKAYAPWGVKINPSAEFFLFNMVAFGGTALFSYDKLGSDKIVGIGVGPIFSIYYNGMRTVIPYFSISGLYYTENLYWKSTKQMYWTDMAFIGGAKIGAIFMLSRQAGFFVDGRFEYGYHNMSTPANTVQTKVKGWEASSYVGFKYFIF